MIEALVTSIITYGTLYVDMKNTQRIQINTLIRNVYKFTMGL